VAVGIGIYVTATIAVAVAAHGRIRFTAESAATIPMWYPWLPAVTGVALALLAPPQQPVAPECPTPASRDRIEAFALIGLAVVFTLSLTLLGPIEPNYTLLKLGLLVMCPLLLFAAARRQARTTVGRESPFVGDRRRCMTWRPLFPVLGWATTYMALSAHGPAQRLDMDWVTLAVALVLGFFINAVVEELFYRKWLQTRWSRVLGGTWPAVILSSLVWASWHIAIQGSGDPAMDLANTIVNQGVTGLFLGLLWARYRAMWPLLVTHGLINANPVTLFF
jgi:membrane protease YdiL (CAAX protease family)